MVKILVLGGVGFIGRNLVKFLVDNNLASEITVADKSMPMTSYFSPEHQAPFNNKELVKFKQADLAQDAHVQRVFDKAEYDFVVNCCGETRFGLPDDNYKSMIELAAQKCAAAAAAMAHKPKWIEISTAQVYAGPKKGQKSDEAGKLGPWTKLAVSRMRAEEIVKASGLEHVILRPSIVYGKGDLTGITPRLVIGLVHKYKNGKDKLKYLFGPNLGLSTVHVNDVCAAIWAACKEIPSGSVYNLSDSTGEGYTTQALMSAMLGETFGIQTGWYNQLMEMAASKLAPKSIANEANEKYVPVWAKICQDRSLNTPLSPYIDEELLKNTSLSIDGEAITKNSSFKYSVPQMTAQTVKDQIDTFVAQKLWPEDWQKIQESA